MPLPPALAAKLSKRGIITPKHKPSEPLKKIDYKGLSTCPNKNNIFHECTRWCETHWKGVLTPEPKYMRNMQKLLAKFPLPNNWTEVFDKGVGRYYYWNMETDMVSWLPPKHPKALLTRSAAKLRERRILAEKEEKLRDKDTAKKDKENDRISDKEKDRESDEDDRNHRSKYGDRRDRDRDKEREDRRKRDRDDRHRRDKEKRQKKDDQLDPMDPAAYSDVPQGTWSDGLETNKIRADNTASGVLFQQRPYPAPGAVLAANKDKDRKK
ncbi:polyglutamine-binding protein 1-like [Sitophilus oryzae]|uniref:Polyglutamine-binding protein 1 n=1 Tax=Sitophilus oryzae TaxID=7048 RepID=A0A6J2YQ62_SITOR|nr:polyglutamine-binding protein 1-like [Sitophilus oryzae]